MDNLKIGNDAEYQDTLELLEQLAGAEPGSDDYLRLENCIAAVRVYELNFISQREQHWANMDNVTAAIENGRMVDVTVVHKWMKQYQNDDNQND